MNDAVKALRKKVEEAGSQKAVAEEFGISCAYLSDILNERSNVSDNIAQKLGYRWTLIPDDPALEEYLHKFVRAPSSELGKAFQDEG
jgi:antitoxin component HigA of HigAB toxin-antitoxin module